MAVLISAGVTGARLLW